MNLTFEKYPEHKSEYCKFLNSFYDELTYKNISSLFAKILNAQIKQESHEQKQPIMQQTETVSFSDLD